MTTSIKVRTNGNYVAEVKTPEGDVLGHAGPGTLVESDWIYVPHGVQHILEERAATPEEAEAAKAALDKPAA